MGEILPVPPIRKLPQASYTYAWEGRQNGNRNYRKLTKLITWIRALSNSMKLWAMLCRATQDGGVMVESSDKMRSLEKGMTNYFSILPLRNQWTVWKGKRIWHWMMNSHRSVGAQYATGEEWRNSSRKNEEAELKQNNTPFWMWLVMEVKADSVKNNAAQEPGMFSSWIRVNWKWSNRKWQEWTSPF